MAHNLNEQVLTHGLKFMGFFYVAFSVSLKQNVRFSPERRTLSFRITHKISRFPHICLHLQVSKKLQS